MSTPNIMLQIWWFWNELNEAKFVVEVSSISLFINGIMFTKPQFNLQTRQN